MLHGIANFAMVIEIETLTVSLYLSPRNATQPNLNATHSRNGNESLTRNPTPTHCDGRCLPPMDTYIIACLYPELHVPPSHADNACQIKCRTGASQQLCEVWRVKRGEERRRQTCGVHAHFTHVILYTSTASIEASLDYYMNKNIILCPACLELI